MVKKRTLKPESMYARHRLEQWLTNELGVTARHRHLIWKHHRGDDDTSLSQVPDLPNLVRQQFGQVFCMNTSQVVEEKASEHGRKLVIELQDNHLIETVIIRHTPQRSTVCVSSQVGCQMGCTFCATGTLGKIANLTAAEIVEQVHHARGRDQNISGVVFMGMGEPLDNYDQVLEAIQSLAEPSVLQGNPIPLRRITLSTVGVVPAIRKLSKDCPQIQLALSLHAPNDEIRQQIVPTTKAFSIAKIFQALDEYQQVGGTSLMIEYIMIDSVNAGAACAHELGRLLAGRKCMVNLIPYNPTEAGDRFHFAAPPDDVMEAFSKILYQFRDDKQKPLRCAIRWSSRRGQDIDAACGQLALKNLMATSHSAAARKNPVSGDMEDIGKTSLSNKSNTNTVPNGKKTRRERKNAKNVNAMPTLNWPKYWPAILAGALVLGGTILLRPRRRH